MNKIAKDKEVNLFVYGNLQYAHSKYDAFAFGELRHRFSRDAAAKFGEKYKTKVYGQIHKVSEKKIKALDISEKPEYKRIKIKLNDGTIVFTYEYIKNDFEDHKLIQNGKYKKIKNMEKKSNSQHMSKRLNTMLKNLGLSLSDLPKDPMERLKLLYDFEKIFDPPASVKEPKYDSFTEKQNYIKQMHDPLSFNNYMFQDKSTEYQPKGFEELKTRYLKKGDNKMSLLQKLAELANELDTKGYYVEAEQIDQVLKQAVDMSLDMADAPMKPHQGTPPQMVPAPKLETKPNPPVALPPKQEKPAPQMADAPQAKSPGPTNPAKPKSLDIPPVENSKYKKNPPDVKLPPKKDLGPEADDAMYADAPAPRNPAPFKAPEQKPLPAPEIPRNTKLPPQPPMPPKKDLGPK